MFYTFRQNNSYGETVRNNDVADYVIIEADCYHKANELAEKVGLYFDGVGDCPCCGNRWQEFYDEDGTVSPEVYGDLVAFINNGEKQLSVYGYDKVIIYPLGSIA